MLAVFCISIPLIPNYITQINGDNIFGGDTMRKQNRNNEQCCNQKDKKNLEFACELTNVEERRNEKDCGGGRGGKR